MAIRKFFLNKFLPGWKINPACKPAEKLKAGEKQKYNERKYWSWGYDLDLESVEFTSSGQPKRNRLREGGFPNRSDAEAAAARLLVEEKDRKYGYEKKTKNVRFPTLRETIEAFLPTLQHKHTRRIAATVLQRFRELAAEKLGKPDPLVTDVTTALMWDYVKDRLDNGGVQPETVNREMNAIASCLHKAPEFSAELKDWQAPKIARPKLKKSRRGQVWRDEESAKLYRWLTAPEWRTRAAASGKLKVESKGYYKNRFLVAQMFVFSSLAATRVAEIYKMKWDDVHLPETRGGAAADWVRVIDWKTGGERIISPIPPTMREILLARRVAAAGEYVFTLSGSIPVYFYDILREGCAACGIKYGKKIAAGLRFHDLRHTATTNLLSAGIDIPTVQSITGHSDETMVLYYSHSSRESRSKASQTLENSISWTQIGHEDKQ